MSGYSISPHDSKWFAVYTRSRSEKKLNTLLTQKRINCFLPLKKSLRQRSDRKVWVEEPLLRSYIFVKTTESERFDVLNTPGAICYICFEGRPAVIPDEQIRYLENFISNRPNDIEICQSNLKKGKVVEVAAGPLKGVKGEVMEIRGKQRLLLRFESLGCCVHAEISMHELVKNS